MKTAVRNIIALVVIAALSVPVQGSWISKRKAIEKKCRVGYVKVGCYEAWYDMCSQTFHVVTCGGQ